MCFRPPEVSLKPLKCPECGKRINNPNYRPENCPYCGAEIEKKTRGEIEQKADTALVKITGFTVNTKTPAECRSYQELLEYAKMMGYKPGWAYFQAKQRGLLHGA